MARTQSIVARVKQPPPTAAEIAAAEAAKLKKRAEEHEQHVRCVLESQLVRLTKLPWLISPTARGPALSAQDHQSAAVQLGAVQARTHGLRAAVDQLVETLSPAPFGLHALAVGVTLLEQRVQATAELCQQQHQQRPRIEPPWPAAAVFSNSTDCKRILACLGRGYWLFVAGTSQTLRGTYMAVVAEACDSKWLCKTSVYAAAHSVSAFDFACQNGLSGSDELKRSKVGKTIVETGNAELTSRALDAGMAVDEAMLAAAAAWCDVVQLHKLCRRSGRIHTHGKHALNWCKVAVAAVASAHWRDILVWLSQQTMRCSRYGNPWPAWLTAGLCARAASLGRLDVLQWLLRTCSALFIDVKTDVTYGSLNLKDQKLEEVFSMCFKDSAADSDGYVRILSVLDTAASRGHQHIVEYLRSQAHAYTEHTAPEAALRGHFTLLKWLRAQSDCPFDVSEVVRCTMMCKTAVPEQLAWLLELQEQSRSAV
ncbi:hypothetical protein JKP88DRAFT_250899 [Tribonema minus]|uniref:Uncharacterized protein n=1 Tax=Tribonema minus TaxID=303371 RepID=A0A835ZK58_9STRA|nr:hypothetical protein JKP88DRAFT_250899 [Tribonema minus]